ncbi:MAG: metallophosphoesterase [Spirochaetota bacterium]|nr:metallophosphoesterase [Spirochaetota bacterium]
MINKIYKIIFFFFILTIIIQVSCLRPAEERADLDRKVGKGNAGGVHFDVQNGLAAVRKIEAGELELWLQAPGIRIDVETELGCTSDWILTLKNCMPDAELNAVSDEGNEIIIDSITSTISTELQWSISLPQDDSIIIEINSPDSDIEDEFKFAVLSDIQDGIDKVDDIYNLINEYPMIRFVISTGDLVTFGKKSELRKFQRKLKILNIPFFSTVGNHELGSEPENWFHYFGRANVNFSFKGVHFSLIDSGNATIDPDVYKWLKDWLGNAKDDIHIFATHFSPIDPIGLRNGSFASRKEAAKLLSLLARGNVDVTFYGHVHSFYEFSNAGIPAYISGGGGGVPEQFDGIGRHFLITDVLSGNKIKSVSVMLID